MNLDNPARRLLQIIEDGLSKAAHRPCLEVWQEILYTKGNLPLTMSRIGKVMELPTQVVQTLLDLYPNHEDVWSHWREQITNGFTNQRLNEGWHTFMAHIDANSVTMLKMTATIIDAKLTTQTIDTERIAEFQNALTELLTEISESDLSNDLKVFVVRKLREIIVSIEEYRLTGLMPILDAVDSAIGHTATNKEYAEFIKDKSLGQKFRDILVDVANVVTSASGIISIAGEVLKQLPN